jgi:hypothetical protein
MRALRWFLIVPAAVAAWYLVFFLGLVAYGVVESRLCPDHKWVSGTCTDERVEQILEVLIDCFVAASGFVVVITAATVSPDYKPAVAWTTFVLGAVAALVFANAGEAWGQAMAAIVAGGVAVFAIGRSSARRAPA